MWIVSKNTEKQLIVFENKILRKIFGLVWDSGKWRVRTNNELRELYREPYITGIIKSRLRWTGHVLRKGFNHEGCLGGKTDGV